MTGRYSPSVERHPTEGTDRLVVSAPTVRRSLAAEDRDVARRIGARLRAARLRAGMTQRQVAEGRYTKAYISALENGLIKPSVAALNFIAERLGTTAAAMLADPEPAWLRLEADVRLAAGEWDQALGLYDRLLDGSPDPVATAEILLGKAEALARLGRVRDSLAAAVDAAARFEDLGRPSERAESLYWVASAHGQAGNLDEAREIVNRLLVVVRDGLDVAPDFEVRLLIALAMTESMSGEPGRALAHLTEATNRVALLDDRRRARYLFSLAMGYRRAGDYEAAIRAGTQGIGLFRAADAASETASLGNELALVYLSLGNIARAREYAAEARRQFEAEDDRRWLAHVVETEARIELAAGDAARARQLADEAIAIAEQGDNPRALLSAHLTAARSSRDLGDREAAHAHFEAAAGMARSDADSIRREVLSEWGDLHATEGNVARAYELAREALAAPRS